MNRRTLLGGLSAGAAAGFLGGRRAKGAGRRRTLAGGWLGRRVGLVERRLLGEGFPTFSPRFVLADVALDPAYPRLYDRFSGDVSGRYLEALATMATPAADARLPGLLRGVLEQQRADGRFGDGELRFDAASVGREHMALLWGNGRLLVGLLACQAARPDPAVLAAARRLGDFLVRVRAACAQPEVRKRLEGQGAYGLICFTQLIEGLVMLAAATGERGYLAAAAEIAPNLPPPGVQHTHGYLSTLRGILALAEATGEARHRAFVEKAFADVVRSPDYLDATGGVLEFFGAETPGLSAADLKKLGALDNKDAQDEGCSVSDLLRLALGLWRATGEARYLDAAERCLLNHFAFNQFWTGDFGHHVLYLQGFRPTQQVGMAWWCCTMHGARAFRDVLDAVVTRRGDTVALNLFVDAVWEEEGRSLRVARAAVAPKGQDERFMITAGGNVELAIRRPPWAAVSVTIDGRPAATRERDGYLVVAAPLRRGVRLAVDLAYRTLLRTRDRRVLRPEELGPEPVEAALHHGPWLLGVHEQEEPLFLRRPWAFASPNNFNRILLPSATAAAGRGSLVPPIGRRFAYVHGGWPERGEVTLRPIAAQSDVAAQQVLAFWLHFQSQ